MDVRYGRVDNEFEIELEVPGAHWSGGNPNLYVEVILRNADEELLDGGIHHRDTRRTTKRRTADQRQTGDAEWRANNGMRPPLETMAKHIDAPPRSR